MVWRAWAQLPSEALECKREERLDDETFVRHYAATF
jgi:hypothetical protein